MVPKAGALAPPGIGEPIAPICVDDPGARVPGDGPRAGVPMVDIPCAKPGPARHRERPRQTQIAPSVVAKIDRYQARHNHTGCRQARERLFTRCLIHHDHLVVDDGESHLQRLPEAGKIGGLVARGNDHREPRC